MTVSQSGGAPIYRQTNSGPGTFVGGNNYGKIEVVDGKTRAVLDRLSIEAPALAKLLSQALRDGLISPNTAFALEMAARNINGDVVEALYVAGRNINHDVAQILMHAGNSINGHVAEQITSAAHRLEVVARQLDQTQVTVQNLSRVVGELSDLDETADALDGVSQNLVMATSRVPNGNWSWNSFRWGMFCCFISVVCLLALYAYANSGP